MGSVEVAIMSCPREPVYAPGLLSKMFEREDMSGVRVRVVVDGNDAWFLGPWADDERLELDLLAEPPREPIGNPLRIMRTFRRCIDGARGDIPLVVLQDDAEVAYNWLKRSLDGYEMARKRSEDEFFIALWSKVALSYKDDLVVPMLVDYFFGNVGLLFPPYVVRELRFALREPEFQTWPDDMAVKRVARMKGWQVYSINPNVVQHIGGKSTHGADGNIISPSYEIGTKETP